MSNFEWFEWTAVALVSIFSAARITRLLTFDTFPPIAWFRDKYADATDGTKWQILAYCPYCMSFWVTIAVVLSGYFSDFHEAWWLTNGIFGGAYLAAMVMVRDGDDEDDD